MEKNLEKILSYIYREREKSYIYIYIYDWIITLYIQNVVNHLYLNVKKKICGGGEYIKNIKNKILKKNFLIQK